MKMVLIFIFLYGCKSEYIPEPFVFSDLLHKNKCDSTLKLIWQVPIFKDSIETAASVYRRGNKLFYQYSPGIDNRPSEFGQFEIKKNTINYVSKLKSDYKLGFYLFNNYENSFLVIDDIICYTDGGRLYGLNLNLEIIWKINPNGSREEGYGNPHISNYKDLIFFPSYNPDIINSTGFGLPNHLFGVDINSGEKKILYTEPESKHFKSFVEAPVAIQKGEDLIIVFQIRKTNFYNGHSQSDLVSWNITQNKQIWRIDSLDRFGIGSVNPILYEDGKIYYATAGDIYCFDPISGKEYWRQSFKNFPFYFQSNNLLLTEKGLIVKSNDPGICLLNKDDGQIIWENRDVGSTPNQLLYFKGDVFFNCGNGTLQCVNASTGIIKFKAESPNECKDNRAHYAINQFFIDPDDNKLYISDDFFLQCFQLQGYELSAH